MMTYLEEETVNSLAKKGFKLFLNPYEIEAIKSLLEERNTYKHEALYNSKRIDLLVKERDLLIKKLSDINEQRVEEIEYLKKQAEKQYNYVLDDIDSKCKVLDAKCCKLQQELAQEKSVREELEKAVKEHQERGDNWEIATKTAIDERKKAAKLVNEYADALRKAGYEADALREVANQAAEWKQKCEQFDAKLAHVRSFMNNIVDDMDAFVKNKL